MNDTSGIFEQIFRNAKQNAILIMSGDGLIQRVNEAFTTAFGYSTEDLQAKHLRLLFLEKDQITLRPEIELNTTQREGSSTDENYLVHKDGTPVWVTGESILIKTKEAPCIIKIIHNIHALKQLERYLLSSHELLDSLFESVQQTGLLLLDAQLRTLKVNGAFARLFALENPLTKGSRLQEISHPFWQSEEIKADVRNALVQNMAIKKDYPVNGNEDAPITHLRIVTKPIHNEETAEKQLLLVIKKV